MIAYSTKGGESIFIYFKFGGFMQNIWSIEIIGGVFKIFNLENAVRVLFEHTKSNFRRHVICKNRRSDNQLSFKKNIKIL